MLLKGIFLTFIGINGIIITIIWIIKSFNEANKKEVYPLYNNKSLQFPLQRQATQSTVLLDRFILDKEIQETVLLDEEER
ncbi:hypothetical protein [Paramaledivibacter caminithermalis]|jgi:hypothetical protein|uniref:Uncharacterized protein n=1 Tax=Paramaledivibacter caminithermalis (strain DSM 15212 / CIP 107654 / DViRD3) TaxID=1121301 RepID=A0A1M6PIA6_PARC5|nr:hypothetical protein [Paramaledivibacter caminithermalis]SHK07657.1 hypothetical protein SAMN02745912_02173 [Paramaledivibacter caminithermalis DSM 15212]